MAGELKLVWEFFEVWFDCVSCIGFGWGAECTGEKGWNFNKEIWYHKIYINVDMWNVLWVHLNFVYPLTLWLMSENLLHLKCWEVFWVSHWTNLITWSFTEVPLFLENIEDSIICNINKSKMTIARDKRWSYGWSLKYTNKIFTECKRARERELKRLS